MLTSIRPPVLTLYSGTISLVFGLLHSNDLVELPYTGPSVPPAELPLEEAGSGINVVMPPEPIATGDIVRMIHVGGVPVPAMEL